MRLVTFNILSGRSVDDGVVDPRRLAAAVRDLDPDVLALQEVDLNQPRSHGVDLTEVAAEAMGAVDHRFAPALDGTPGGHWVAITGQLLSGRPQYGVSLLSRYPVRNWDLLQLPGIGPHFPLPLPVPAPAARRSVLVGEEPRVALSAELMTPRGPLVVAAAHLSFLPGWNVLQLRMVNRSLSHHADPVVIMGDLNLPAPLPARATGYRPLASHRTFPVRAPRLQIDHILLRGDLGPVRASQARRMPLSDHRALLVDVG